MSRGKRAVFFAVLAVLVLVTGEALVSVAALVSPELRLALLPDWQSTVPDPLLGHRMSPAYPGHDERGYRNDESAVPVDVLAVGDSLTYGFSVTSEESWPRQLEMLTGRSVYNAGVGGYGPCEYVHVVEELLSLEPTTVIVGLYLGNDIGGAFRSVYLERRCENLKSQDAAVLSAMSRADEIATLPALAERYGDVTAAREAQERSDWLPFRRWLSSHSKLYQLARAVRELWLVPADGAGAAFLKTKSFESAAPLPNRLALTSADGRIRTIFRNPEYDALAVDLGDPRVREGLRITVYALRNIKDRTAKRNTRFHVAILHNKPYALADVLRGATLEVPPAFDRLVALEEELTLKLRELLRRENIPFSDTYPDFQAVLESGQSPFHESDDHHPNGLGYKAIASHIARQVIDQAQTQEGRVRSPN